MTFDIEILKGETYLITVGEKDRQKRSVHMRSMTLEEIDFLLRDIPSFFPNHMSPTMKESYLSSMMHEIRSKLSVEQIEDDFDQWEALKNKLERKISRAIVQAGESVGVICAQSIGERQTQLSIAGDTPIVYCQEGTWIRHHTIGSIVDSLLETRRGVTLEDHESQVYPCWDSDEFKISMVRSDGHVCIARIVEWSRHRNHGMLMTLRTESGRYVTSTLSHSHLRRNHEGKIVPILGSDVRIGDEVPFYSIDPSVVEFETACQVEWERVDSIVYKMDHDNVWVYDISVEGNQTFQLANGLFVHNTLNSFHQSGLAVTTVVTGVPRFLELLNATKDPKMVSNSFEFREKDIQSLSECRERIGSQLVQTHFHEVIMEDKIHVMEKPDEYWYTAYEILYGSAFRAFSSCISFTLNKERLYERKVTLLQIQEAIEKQYQDLRCVISPLHVAQIDVFVETRSIREPSDNLQRSLFEHRHPVDIYLTQVVLPKLMELKIAGIANIHHYYYQKTKEDRWRIETEGANISEILSLPFVHQPTVRSNHMWDIYQIMGIEATRQFLIDEFTKVVSSDGTFINPSHIFLLVDIMTYQGTINSISRYGMKREEMGVLTRASFEESLDQFCKAGCYAEMDPIRAVSAKIMCGKRSSIGSGICHLRMDWNKMKRVSSTTKPQEHTQPYQEETTRKEEDITKNHSGSIDHEI